MPDIFGGFNYHWYKTFDYEIADGLC